VCNDTGLTRCERGVPYPLDEVGGADRRRPRAGSYAVWSRSVGKAGGPVNGVVIDWSGVIEDIPGGPDNT